VARLQGPSGLLRFQVVRATAVDGQMRVQCISWTHLPLYHEADGHALTADVANHNSDKPEAEIDLGVGHHPEPTIGWSAVDVAADCALNLDSFRCGGVGSRSTSPRSWHSIRPVGTRSYFL
jgi:metal-dependent amidase/aminoacylase/carboxypeptidase family protein